METKKVKCVKKYVCDDLSLNKIYEAYIEDSTHYLIKNDKEYKRWYPKHQLIEIVPYNTESYYVSTSTAIDPKHYQLPIEPKDFIIKNKLGFCEGNVIKYICRYKQKNGVEDLKKAKQYIDFLINEYETTSNR